MIQKNWIKGAVQDSVFILLPPFFILAIIIAFPGIVAESSVSPFMWLLLVVCIDVAHVYSTLYRTYFDKSVFSTHKTVLTLTPLLVFIAGAIVYSFSDHLFWRCAAYLAVFHFIRQQYGFMRIYARKDAPSSFLKIADSVFIYTATLYPILHWHLTGPHEFNWFVDDDFIYFNLPVLLSVATVFYYFTICTYSVIQIIQIVRIKSINLAKLLLATGTAVSWYAGIVYFKGDLTFTLLNVVSHGIPYIALVWFTGSSRSSIQDSNPTWLKKIFHLRMIPVFLGILLLFAFAEEFVWDITVWHDHPEIFGSFQISVDWLLAIIVPLLSVPQFTHYVIDGFIWKIRSDKYHWSKETLK